MKRILILLSPVFIILILIFFMILNICTVAGFCISSNKEIAVGIDSTEDKLVYIYDNNNIKNTINIKIRGSFVLKCENDQICIYVNGNEEKLTYDFNGNLLKEEHPTYTNPTAKFNKKQEINIDDISIKYNKNFFGYESIIKTEKGVITDVLPNGINIYSEKLFVALWFVTISSAIIIMFFKKYIKT